MTHPGIAWCLAADHGERFALVAFADGAVLLDLDSGTFFRLNPSATVVCGRLARGEAPAEAAAHLARTYGLDLAAARRDVDAVLAQMQAAAPPIQTNPIRFAPGPAGLRLSWEGHPILEIDPAGRTVTRLAADPEAVPEPWQQLLWAAPHLLLLRQQLVLHASAVRLGDGVTALCGPSGAGKTTLAQTFAAVGRPAVSEDLVLFAFDGETPEVILEGEAAVRAWAAAEAPRLAAGGRVTTDGLAAAARGPRAPLREAWFVRRSADARPTLHLTSLARPEALVRLLENSFAELGQRGLWRQLLDACRRVVLNTRAAEVWCPDGLERLRHAVAAYADAR